MSAAVWIGKWAGSKLTCSLIPLYCDGKWFLVWQKGQPHSAALKSTCAYPLRTAPQVLHSTGSYGHTCAHAV